jgi:RDD family protein
MKGSQPIEGPGGAETASIRRRFAAAAFDVTTFVAAMVPIVAGAVLAGRLFGGGGDRCEGERPNPFARPAVMRSIVVAGIAAEVFGRNWRSPGMRLMRIRKVDATTGGPVTVRSALTASAVDFAWGRLNSRLWKPMQLKTLARAEAAKEEKQDIERRYADDPYARRAALVELNKRGGFRPLRSSAPGLTSIAVMNLIPSLLSARNQRLPERLAGTVVIVEG